MMFPDQTRQISGAISNNRSPHAAQRRENQFAEFAVGNRSQLFGRNDFCDEFAFEQVHAAWVRFALTRNRTSLGHPVTIKTFRAPHFFRMFPDACDAEIFFSERNDFLDSERSDINAIGVGNIGQFKKRLRSGDQNVGTKILQIFESNARIGGSGGDTATAQLPRAFVNDPRS